MAESSPGQSDRIVVGVDGSEPSRAALSWAARQAELTGVPLEVVMAWEFPPMYGFAIGVPEGIDLAADAAGELTKLTAEVLGPNPPVEVVPTVIEGHPALVLQDLSAASGLLVVGCRGRGAFRGMVLGSVSAFLASHAKCPVVIVHSPRPAEHAKA